MTRHRDVLLPSPRVPMTQHFKLRLQRLFATVVRRSHSADGSLNVVSIELAGTLSSLEGDSTSLHGLVERSVRFGRREQVRHPMSGRGLIPPPRERVSSWVLDDTLEGNDPE